MMWDDHDIRDGWGSFAADSATLADLYPRGAPIHEKYANYFRDAYDVFLHFQMSHNPPRLTFGDYKPAKNPGTAMPFVFRAGRAAILVADGRGQRDIWRENNPVLGDEQWKFLASVADHLEEDVDAVIIVTPVPIVSDDPFGQTQRIVGSRTDDVEMFKKGDEDGLRRVYVTEGTEGGAIVTGANFVAGLIVHGSSTAGFAVNLGNLRLKDIDDVRDHWAHEFSRPEQERLIRLAVHARTANRAGKSPRGLMFVGGDLHCGGTFQIDVAKPRCTFECLFSSGIGKNTESEFPGLRSTVVDREFDVAEGIRATLKSLIKEYNFGVVTIVPNGPSADITGHVIHTGSGSETWGLSLGQPPVLNRARERLKGLF
jgi:hypothetical protein